MKNIKKLIATITLASFLMIGVSTANAGILMTDGIATPETKPCHEVNNDSDVDWGIVITGFTGIVITGFTGIVITGAVETTTDCGIVITG